MNKILFFIIWWYATGFSIGGMLILQYLHIIKRNKNLNDIKTSYIANAISSNFLESELSIYAIVNGRKFYCKDTGNFLL